MIDPRFDYSGGDDTFRVCLISDPRFLNHPPFFSDTAHVRIHWQSGDQYDWMKGNNIKEDQKTD